MDPLTLLAWRNHLELSQRAAARQLGLSHRGYQNYEYGLNTIPTAVALACSAIARRLGEWQPRED